MSDLQRIQQEILRRFQRPRTTAEDIPGFAGGNLQEQLDREGQSPDRMSGVRSSNVFAPPQQQRKPADYNTTVPASPNARSSDEVNYPTRPQSVFAPPRNSEGVVDFRVPKQGEQLPPVSMSRDRRAEPRDYVADDSQYLRDLETKPRTWKDKGIDALRGVNQALGSNPNVFTPTRREREELKARGMLGQDIAIQREQTAQQMAQMVPIYDADGKIVGTAPRRTAANTQLRATQIGNTVEDRRKGNLLKEMNGVRDFDPADPANADYVKRYTEEFGTPPLKRTSGSLYVLDKGTDANGNATYNVIQKDTGTATAVTGGNLPSKSDQQLNREQHAAQFKTLQDNLDRRAKARNAQSERNATIMAGGVVARMGDPDVHKRNMAEIDEDMDGVDKEMDGIIERQKSQGFLPTDPATLNQLRQRKNTLERERRDEREKLGKIESAQGNLKTRGGATTNKQSPEQGSFNLGAWKADHPNATPDQIQAQRAKAKARKLAIVE